MKYMKRLFALGLALCMALTMIPSAHAMSLQEQSWLSLLRPKLPELEGSYPARLLVTLPSAETVTLNGTCGVGGTVTDEQLIDILKRACSAVEGYKDPQNAVNDMVLAAAIKEKLKFTEEDMAQLQQNFLALSGFDKVADLLNLTMPGVGGSDMASIAAEIITEGEVGLGFLNPIPDSLGGFAQGLIINGVFVTWEEFQRDKEKYKDIVNMSQANARLRQYYGRVDELLRDAMSDNTAWAIRIYEQKVVDTLYDVNFEYYAPCIYTADIELVKDDGSYGNIDGTYTGRFKLSSEFDLTGYDSNYHVMYAKFLNSSDEDLPFSSNRHDYSPVSITVNRPTEEKITLEKSNVSVTLSMPPGMLRTRFELPLDATALEQTEFVSIQDMVVEVEDPTEYRGDAGKTHIRTIIKDSETGTHYDQYYVIYYPPGEPPIEHTNVNDDYIPTDVRPYIQMTLVVDMT